MSTPRNPALVTLSLLAVVTATGCWEQVSSAWFPQMKRQRAVQAFEEVQHRGQMQGFSPPPGTVPVGAAWIPDVASMDLQVQEALPNPTPGSYESLKRGDVLYHRYCITCHGATGLGDGPVAASSPFAPHATGPFAMVFPLAGPLSMSRIVTDGHIYTTMTLGRNRMPSYNRIPPEQRWDLVNYIRELNRQGGGG